MKTISLSAIFATALVTSTSAGNFETPAAIPTSPAIIDQNIWSGFYAGAIVSFVSSEMYSVEIGAVDPNGPFAGFNGVGTEAFNAIDHTDFGIFAGKNWQRNNFVFGIDGSLELSNAYSLESGFGGQDDYAVFDRNFTGTLSARGGYAFGNVLVYGKVGGAALSGTFGMFDDQGTTIDSRESKVAFGLNYGGGIEVLFNRNWSAKVEYSVQDFGTISTFGVSSGSGAEYQWDHDISSQAISVGIARHF